MLKGAREKKNRPKKTGKREKNNQQKRKRETEKNKPRASDKKKYALISLRLCSKCVPN